MCLLQHPYIASLLATHSSIPPSHSFSQSIPSLSTYFLFFSTLHSFPTFFPSASPSFTLFLQFTQSSVPSTPQYTTLFWHTPSPALCPIFYIFSSSSGLRTHMTNIMRKPSWQYALPTLPSCYTPGAKNSFCTKLLWWVLSNLSSLWKKIQLASSRIFSKIILWGSRSSAARFSQGARIQFLNYRSMNCPKNSLFTTTNKEFTEPVYCVSVVNKASIAAMCDDVTPNLSFFSMNSQLCGRAYFKPNSSPFLTLTN